MASLILGFHVIETGVLSPRSYAYAAASELNLTGGERKADAVIAVDPSATETLWQSPNHGVSATEPSCDVAVVQADPLGVGSGGVDLILSYTTPSATTVTTLGVYPVLEPGNGAMVIPGVGQVAGVGERYLTKIEARNRSADGSAYARAQVWG